MKIIVFDFEVFRYDTLLGAYIVNENRYFQTWDSSEIKKFYYENQNSIWIGHNNSYYDNHILEAIIKNKNVFEVSQNIVNNEKRYYLNIPLNYYDIIDLHFISLKVLEAAVGKYISESAVDFNLDRPLLPEEKTLTESYNRDDLNQTFEDLKLVKSEFQLRLDLIKEFNLTLDALHYTQAQIAEAVLKAERIHGIDGMRVSPVIYPQMRIKNQVAIDYYLSDGFRGKEKPVITLCDVPHQMGAGGMHAGRENYRTDAALYLDVSGYYNLVMINYNLLSRAIPEEGKKLYEFMYHEQLRLKKIDPVKRAVYKTILLAVFGAQMNQYCKFYDPWNGALVPVVGQMFMIDLLEKLEGKIELIQTNTDGIIVKPLPLIDEREIMDIVKEWCDRTGFVIKPERIYDIVQRDVNNYMYRDDNGKIHTKGEAVGYYECWENPLLENSYNSKEPIIIHYGIVEWFMNGKRPEETVLKYASNVRMFQWILRPNTYDYLTFESVQGIEKLQKVNRCFASKEPGMVYKNKKDKHDRYSALPDKVFIWNESIETIDRKRIDYIYYVRRIMERINQFIPDEFKKVRIN